MKNAFESLLYTSNISLRVACVNVLCAKPTKPKLNKAREIIHFFIAVALRRHVCLVNNIYEGHRNRIVYEGSPFKDCVERNPGSKTS